MKLNQKGVTLVELIVSFALVAVAIVYFYQTLYTVKNLYSKAQRETNEYVDVNYAYRIIDALYNNLEEGDNICDKINDYKDKDNNFKAEPKNPCLSTYKDDFQIISFTIDNKEYKLYRYGASEESLTTENISERLQNIISNLNINNGEDLKKKLKMNLLMN